MLDLLRRSLPPGLRRTLGVRAKRMLHPAPLRLGRLGSASLIYRPRQIQGARHIHVGERSIVCGRSWIAAISDYAGCRYVPRLEIGDDVYIGQYASIQCASRIVIGSGCVISEYVYMADCSHGLDPQAGLILKQPLRLEGDVEIGDNTFIGYRVSILPGVTLGRHCVVGAHSVVTRSFPDYSMVVGAPARLIKRYSFETRQWVPVK